MVDRGSNRRTSAMILLTAGNNEQVNRGRPVSTLGVHLHRNDGKV